jgi:hypothetical protein
MTRPRTTPAVLAALALSVAVALAGCGSGDDAATSAATTAAATAAATGTATPAITVARPASGATVASPMRVAGTANTFEATVQVRLTADDGRVLNEQFVTATSGSGTRGTYEASVPFRVQESTPATLRLYESSAEDGSEINAVEVPVVLTP